MRRLFLAALLAACGDDDGGGASGPGAPAPGDEVSAACADFSAHADACGWGGNINGTDWNCGEAGLVWRSDVFHAVADCATALDCAGDGLTCLRLADEATPLAIHHDYASACESRKAECSLVGTGDASSVLLLCSADTLAPYANPVLDEVLACFAMACEEVVGCLEGVL